MRNTNAGIGKNLILEAQRRFYLSAWLGYASLALLALLGLFAAVGFLIGFMVWAH